MQLAEGAKVGQLGTEWTTDVKFCRGDLLFVSPRQTCLEGQ